MTTATLSYDPQPRVLPVPLVLGLQEGRRIVLHPLFLVGLALDAFLAYDAQHRAARGAFELVTDGPTFFWGVFTTPPTVPGAALLVMLAMIVACTWLYDQPLLRTLSPCTSWPVWAGDDDWAGLHPGSAAWHVGYLASLCAMAATGTFLREAHDRVRVLCVGGACTAAAVVTGLLSLP